MSVKKYLIPVFIFLGVTIVGLQSNAYARSTQAASNVSFNMSQEIDYYLKGSFNGWTQDIEYRFVNNVLEMAPETNKTKEYKLENIPLDKDVQLKIWANNDVWFKDGDNNCSYEHSWSNSETFSNNDDHNYIVPMTSNTYSFYLKFYSDGSSKIYITANKDVLFFIPSTDWKKDDAKFAIEQYNDSSEWVQNVTTSVENPSGTFKFVVGTTYTKYKYARRNTDNSSTWNASNILTIYNSDTNNCFSLNNSYWSDWDADGSHGTWSAK